MLKYLSKFAIGHIALGGRDHHRGLHRQSLHHGQARTRCAGGRGVVGRSDRPASKLDACPLDVANIPAAGVRAKGISEKADLRETRCRKAERKTAGKAAGKAAEKSPPRSPPRSPTTSRQRRRASLRTRAAIPAPREKTAVRIIPLTASARAGATRRVDGRPGAAPHRPRRLRPRIPPEEHRDANDLARAAIERLRGGNENCAARAGSRPYP